MTYPATNLNEAVGLIVPDSNAFHNVINGDVNENVTLPEGGEVPTLRKALDSLKVVGDPIGEWTSGVTEFTAYNQYATYLGIPWRVKPETILPYTAQGSDPSSLPDSDFVQPYQENDYGTLPDGIEVKHRRGTSAEIAAYVLADGEIIKNDDDGSLHVGDGLTAGGVKHVTHPYFETFINEYKQSANSRYVISFPTLNYLVNGELGDGTTVDFSELSAIKATVKTDFNNLNVLNEAPGGGASYQILTTADYGGVPDGETIGGVVVGADHYIGGGTDYVAKYVPIKNEIDAEALGYYSGQSSGIDFSDATAVFNKVIEYANGRPIKLGEKQNYYYNGELGDQNSEKDRITILGTSMPSMDYNPNNPKEYLRLKGGTRIRGRMSLWCKSGRFFDFGVDGAPEATNNWLYNYDAFKVITKSTAEARDIQLHNVIGLGKNYDTPAHAIIVSGHRRSTVSNCQGYSTWYGLSIDAYRSVVSGFIGGNNARNVVNAKSHQATASSGSKNNSNMTISNVVGFNPKDVNGDHMGTAILAIEADSNALERVVVTGVSGEGCQSMIGIAPFNGAIMQSVTISGVVGADLDGTTPDYSAIYSRAGSGGGEIYTLNISDVQLSGVHYRAAKFENVRFLNVDNFQANTGLSGVGVAPTLNTDFFHVTSSVVSAMLDGVTLTNSFGLTGGTGQGAVRWDNTAANNRKGPRMLCVNLGTGAP